MAKHRTFTPEFKAQIVMAVLTGDRTVAEVCRQHQLSDILFYRWRTDLLAALPQIFALDPQLEAAQARIAELARLGDRLTLELEVAKKPRRRCPPRRAETAPGDDAGPAGSGLGGLCAARPAAQQLLLAADSTSRCRVHLRRGVGPAGGGVAHLRVSPLDGPAAAQVCSPTVSACVA